MASRMAAKAAADAASSLSDGKARKFYYEICRCLPFIHRTMRLDEMVSVADLRSVVKAQFKQYKDVTNPKVVDRLILKGREELETYLLVHKNRHHVITEYLEPVLQRKAGAQPPTAATLQRAQQSDFLNAFFESR